MCSFNVTASRKRVQKSKPRGATTWWCSPSIGTRVGWTIDTWLIFDVVECGDHNTHACNECMGWGMRSFCQIEDLCRMYDLFSRVPTTLEELRRSMCEYVKSTGKALVTNQVSFFPLPPRIFCRWIAKNGLFDRQKWSQQPATMLEYNCLWFGCTCCGKRVADVSWGPWIYVGLTPQTAKPCR